MLQELIGTHCAVLFKDPNYKGDLRIVYSNEEIGQPAWYRNGNNDVVSSIVVRQGCRFTGYDWVNFQDGEYWRPKTWTKNAPSLKPPYNNDITSWKCFC